MSLPARERRRLSGIQTALHQSDPQLVSLFATFSRLTGEEEMPHMERLRVRVDQFAARGRQLRTGAFSRIRLIVIAPVALAAACAALLIGGWSANPSACRARPAATHAQHRPAPALLQAAFCGPTLAQAHLGLH